VYYFPDPPYVLLVFGLFVSLTSGLAFDSVLKLSVKEWSKNRSTRSLATMRGFQLLFPFVGIAAGSCVFLSAGMEIFGFPAKLAYAIALPLTVFIGWLVWWQLGKILAELDRGGSAALDLDSFES
jgi:hypothetical protein